MAKLGDYIEKYHVRYSDWKGEKELEALGVSNVDGITKTAHKKSDDLSKYLVIDPGCFAFNPYRINVGSIGLTPESTFGLVSPAYIVFKTKKDKLIPELLLDLMKSLSGLYQINKYARGTVRKALRYDDLCQIEFDIPDYQIQLDIFDKKKKIDEKSVLLKTEIQTQKDLVKKLKQSILQEAIEGKLTADWRAANPKTEPASELLKRIKSEKDQLIKDKKIKKEKPLSQIAKEEIPFELPENWVWCRLGDLVRFTDNFNIQTKLNSQEIINYVDIDSINNQNQSIRKVKQEPVINLSSRARRVLKKGYVMYSLVRPYLNNLTIIKDDRPNYIGSTGFAVFECLKVEKNYVFYFLLSSYIRDLYLGFMDGFNSPGISMTQFKDTLIPLPQLEEQKALVEKVENLMQKCQALEQEIKSSEVNAKMLMQAVLKEAFEVKEGVEV